MRPWPPGGGLRAGVSSWLSRIALSSLGNRRIDSWDALHRRLGAPETILCLGNGPSSEADSLSDVRYDCLFRVNWVWRQRGLHPDPAVVFTADTDPPPAELDPIICFPTRGDADRILRAYPSHGRDRRQEYLVFAEMPSRDTAGAYAFQPSNGALMIAAATALKPKRLIIAGIDLNLHPAGKYPGMADEPNEYDAIHDRAVDLDFMRAALRGYEGTLLILSEQLRSHLAQ